LKIVFMSDGAVLDGVLERVTFANPETGYTIAGIAPERGSGVGAEATFDIDQPADPGRHHRVRLDRRRTVKTQRYRTCCAISPRRSDLLC
jgi:hypothetical protein